MHVSLWYIAIILTNRNDFTLHNVAVFANTLGVLVGLVHFNLSLSTLLLNYYTRSCTSGVWSCHAARA